MANKIYRALAAVAFLLRHPSSILQVYADADAHRKEVVRKYNLEKGLPVVDINDLLGSIDETLFPYSFLDGTSTPLDLALLKGFAKKNPGGDYFEIGTWRGESVVNVASAGMNCTTFNLSDEQLRQRNISEKIIELQGFYSKKIPAIRHVFGDSRTFNFNSLNQKFDLIFIDGDHNFESVRNDTAKMFGLLKDERSVIVWHDYGSTPEDIRWEVLHGILDGTPGHFRKNILRVSNTLCSIFIRDNFQTYFSEFPQTPRHKFSVSVQTK
ncbi:MAG TPA: class I SAM-dependent methyltransferase [Bacteroidia bacterium]|nr:class I SAM-dependent methyltransferase [Bacteroidia bacterium]